MGSRPIAFWVIIFFLMLSINVNVVDAGVEPSPFDWTRSTQLFSPSSPDLPRLLIGFDPQPEPPGFIDVIGFDPQPEPPGVVQFGIKLFDPQPEPPGFSLGVLGTGFSLSDPSLSGNEVQLTLLNSKSGNLDYYVKIAFDAGGNTLYPSIISFDPQPEPPGILHPGDSDFLTFFLRLNTASAEQFNGDATVTFSLYSANGTLMPVAPVPEPSTILLLGVGLAGFELLRRKVTK